MALSVRDAERSDFPAILRIAAAGGSPDADAVQFAFVAVHGRLLVAHEDGLVVGVAGALPTGDALMITDLFVDEHHRGRGAAGRLLAALTDGVERMITCSSTHPDALAAYARLGLRPRGRLLTVRGTAVGGGVPLMPGAWRHDRPELVDHFRLRGALVTADAVVLGPAPATDDDRYAVLRLVADDAHAAAAWLLAALPAGSAVELSVPEANPFAAAILAAGFEVVDHDIVCSTEGVEVPPAARCVHRGLL